jgi:hypothetical protein
MVIYALTIFLSAFLLFEVQPMIGKMILPWFGGSAAVWSTCLVYFQVALLLGYLYAHALVQYLTPKRQALIHGALLAFSLATLPIVPSAVWRTTTEGDPTFRILLLLAATIGLPYLLLSATGPLLQAWYLGLRPGSIPYRLYALSNLGSMLALLTYPVAVEPAMAVHRQALVWSGAYVLFAAACIIAAARFAKHAKDSVPEAADSAEALATAPRPHWRQFLIWIALAACPAGLLLAITTQLTHNIAPIPFLWVLPLALYLLSFILCFESDRFYQRWLFLPLLGAALAGMAYAAYYDLGNPDLKLALPVFGAGMFVCSMVCHGELARLKPSPRYLTAFYLAVSSGGAIGGLFVAVVAPHLFRDYYEFPGLLVYCAAISTLAVWMGLKVKRPLVTWFVRGAMLTMTIGVTGYVVYQQAHQSGRFLETRRNFYGVLHVRERPDNDEQTGMRYLLNGTINHGTQIVEAKFHHLPTTYYGPNSGAGRAIQYFEKRGPVRVGVIGLGAGVLAGYCRAGDAFRFYEINPLDLEFARTQFTFLRDCSSPPQVLLGDARLTLERESPQRFDVLAVDAFSSDSIPVHLLTSEAFQLFFRHLASNGILAVHVSNRYLDLAPVVAANASALGKQVVLVFDDGEDEDYYTSSDWVLVAADPAVFKDPIFHAEGIDRLQATPGLRKWTDDYSNLYRILK